MKSRGTIAGNDNGGILWDESSAGQPPLVYNSILWNNGSFEVSPGCEAGALI